MPASLFGKHGKVSAVEMCTRSHRSRVRQEIPPVFTLESELEE